jgi:hypothetical protein
MLDVHHLTPNLVQPKMEFFGANYAPLFLTKA